MIQDYDNIEHLIIDGDSKDETISILKKYENKYNMKWVSEKDGGQADAISKGLNRASGEIHAWLNSDDVYISKSAVSQVVGAFKKYDHADVVTGGATLISKNGSYLQPIRRNDFRVSSKYLKYSDSIIQPATFWKRYVTDEIKIQKELKYTFDWDFFIKCSEKYSILPLNYLIAGYRWHGENKTAVGSTERLEELFKTTEKYMGKYSWQAFLLRFYYSVFVLSEYLPENTEKVVKKIVKSVNRGVRKISSRRITAL
ncbi:glycosyltransferase involved in cell wall biosynthesis [Salinibacter ruber]|nr:glycosyltransferase involved in cell wall biosynthesis [Salinibacter ruber]MCS4181768.1 glycosyltransferase involved in cell wall biosynthesis [Salinibacter ruber]